jgi:leucyl aminopeptidase
MEATVKIKLTAPDKWRGPVRFEFQNSDEGDKRRGVVVPAAVGRCVTAARGPRDQTHVIVSLGPADKMVLDTLRCAAGGIVCWLRERKVGSAGVELPTVSSFDADDCLRAVAEGLLLRDYAFDQHKSQPEKRGTLTVDLLSTRASADHTRHLRDIELTCDAVVTARDLAHEPPNVINPVTLARRVQAIAKKSGLKCTVFDERRLAAMKAGGILAVGQGSATPPRMIVLEYGPRSRGGKPIVLVGKAITFDTGGYSIKPKDGILGMKYDKCGGMAVIGAMQALAALKVNVPVVGIIAAAENMIAGNAYRPDDIITTMSGKTVQIVSADAEGRMVLCDALTYAQKTYKPRCMIDLATLTGGVVIALGHAAAGVFANDEALERGLIEAGQRTHERLWPLPMWDEYFELLKGDDSDFKNSAGREAHATQGAIFLKQFVDEKAPWAHLDIAGVADIEKDAAYCPKGATGFGVRLLVDYIRNL